MSNDNLLPFSRAFRKRNAARGKVDARMVARIEGFRVLIPVVESLRQMGLSDSEIGRFFKFLGHEFCESASDEEQGTKLADIKRKHRPPTMAC